MIKLFNTPNYKIDTKLFSNLLHDEVVNEFEEKFAKYVGAKYACMANSASSLIFLALINYNTKINIPSIMPPVVPNAIINSGNIIRFYDDVDWVGSCYRLHDNIYDSAQEVSKNQYALLNENNAIMIFSFYPTKPIPSCDGGMVVSNNKEYIDYFKIMTMNGMEYNKDSWKRKQITAGYKMHPNSIQAYIANKNLDKLDEKNERLNEIKQIYNEAFELNNTSNHLYRIRVNSNTDFINRMQVHNIQCGIHYTCCHKKKFYTNKNFDLPQSELEESKTVSIPFNEQLSNKQISKIINYVKKLEKLSR